METTADLTLLTEQIRQATATATPLRIIGGGSKDFLGGPLIGSPLNTRALSGIRYCSPRGRWLTAYAGTPLVTLAQSLYQQGQYLAFDPPCFSPTSTLGGCIASGLSGPSRASRTLYGGALRDYLLGLTVINGRGEILQFGRTGLQNKPGLEIARLFAGSMGTLGLLVDITLRVMPYPTASVTLRFECSERQALDSLQRSIMQPWPIEANAWWNNTLLVRLSGDAETVQKASQSMGGELVPATQAASFWANLRDQQDEFFFHSRRAIQAAPKHIRLWRFSLPPNADALHLAGEQLIEWGGCLRWLCTSEPAHKLLERAQALGGSVSLFMAHPTARSLYLTTLKNWPPHLQAWHRAIKHAFDPASIFNRGRLFDDGF